MPDKRIFKIGQLVKVNLNHEVRAGYDGNSREVKRVIEWDAYKAHTNDLVLARITGVKQYWEGEYTAGSESGGFMEPPDYEPAYCTQDQQVVVWGIRLGYRNKEIYFFAEDINRYDFIKKGEDIPYVYNGWTEEYRKKMSRESKDWPRDKKGRWCKG